METLIAALGETVVLVALPCLLAVLIVGRCERGGWYHPETVARMKKAQRWARRWEENRG